MSQVANRHPDTVIIGGGVMGLLTARMLSDHGVAVCLIDAGRLANQSSWAGGGILSPLCPWRAPEAVTSLCRASQARYPALTEALLQETGIDPEWVRSGALFLDSPEIDEASAWFEREGLEYHRVDAGQVARLEPGILGSQKASLWLPGIAQVRNPRLLAALRASLERRDVQLIEGEEVTEFDGLDDRVVSIRTASRTLRAERFVITAGAWTAGLQAGWFEPPQVAPVKGQMLALAAQPGRLTRIVVRGDRYLIPRRDGIILVGSTVESGGFDKSTSDDARTQLQNFAHELMPELAEAELVRHWAGLRPGTPSGIPYIDRHPRFQNAYVCCGHYRNGFVTALASCDALVDMMLDRPSSLDLAPFRFDAVH